MAKTVADKIFARLKGLQKHLREDEQPLFTLPAIWVNTTNGESNACDVVLTNQRLFGYIYTTFPRERLFLDGLELDQLRLISLREKSYQGMFRELLVSDGQKKVYLRAPRKKIEAISTELRSTLDARTASAQSASQPEAQPEQSEETGSRASLPVYRRQELRQPLEQSPLGIALLLGGGLLLEVVGVLIWLVTRSTATGLPICAAGLIAVLVAILARRQLR